MYKLHVKLRVVVKTYCILATISLCFSLNLWDLAIRALLWSCCWCLILSCSRNLSAKATFSISICFSWNVCTNASKLRSVCLGVACLSLCGKERKYFNTYKLSNIPKYVLKFDLSNNYGNIVSVKPCYNLFFNCCHSHFD